MSGRDSSNGSEKTIRAAQNIFGQVSDIRRDEHENILMYLSRLPGLEGISAVMVSEVTVQTMQSGSSQPEMTKVVSLVRSKPIKLCGNLDWMNSSKGKHAMPTCTLL